MTDDERYDYDLIQARLKMQRREWQDARALLEDLLARNPSCVDTKALLLEVEKEQAHLARVAWEGAEDETFSSRRYLQTLGVGVTLLIGTLAAGVYVLHGLHQQGWHGKILAWPLEYTRNGKLFRPPVLMPLPEACFAVIALALLSLVVIYLGIREAREA